MGPFPMTTEPDADLPENYQKALHVKRLARVEMDEPEGWSTDPELAMKPFQKKGMAWLYFAQKGILADQVGLGKTIQALGLIQLLKARGEPFRTLVVGTKAAQFQWLSETQRFTDLHAGIAYGTKSERVSQYAAWWEILVVTYPLLLRDLEYIRNQDIDCVVLDEASTFRHHNIKTAHAVKQLTRGRKRVILLDATPIQTSLLDMHSILETLRMSVFGPLPAFERRYVRREPVRFRRGNSFVQTTKIVGYRNVREFKQRISPFILRRRAVDVSAEMPDVAVENVWLDLPPIQRRHYHQSRRGIIDLFNTGERMQARASFHHLQMACDTTMAFDPTSTSTSVKLDWLIDRLSHDLRHEKVVVFIKYKVTIRDAMDRMRKAGIHALQYTGDESQEDRAFAVKAFWDEPTMQVLIGTSALERSLNLQKSAYLVAVNQLWNPQRMDQLFGRIRRLGSEHSKVVMINLLIRETIEERLHRLLSERAAIADYVFDETSELFEKLSDEQLMSLIQE